MRGNKGLTLFLCVLLAVLILAVSGFCTFYFGYLGDGKVILTQDGTRIESGQSLGRIESGTELGLIGTGEYEIAVYAYAGEGNDFAFAVGEAEYRWQDLAGQDMTGGFVLERDGLAGFGTLTISFSGIKNVLQKFFDTEELTITDVVPEKDLFRLVIAEDGDARLSVTFGLLELESITLDPSYIIF